MDKEITAVQPVQGKAAYTFENFEEMYANAPAPEATPEPVTEEVPEEVPAVEEAPEVPEGEEVIEEAEEEPAEEAKAPEKPAKPVKVHKVKVGEQELEIPETIEFEQKIDGKIVKVPLSQLLKREASTVSIEKQYQDFKKEKDTLEKVKASLSTEKEALTNLLGEFMGCVKEQNVPGLLKKLAEVGRFDPVEFELQFLEQMAPIAKQWSELTEEQKNHLVLQRRNKVYSERDAAHVAKEQEALQRAQLVQQLAQLCEREGVSEAEFSAAWNDLSDLQARGHLKTAALTPQAAVQWHHIKAAQTRVATALEKVDPTLKEDRAVLDAVFDMVRTNKDLTDSDLEEIVRETYGQPRAVERLNKRAAKPGAIQTTKPPKRETEAATIHANGQPRLRTFDDIL